MRSPSPVTEAPSRAEGERTTLHTRSTGGQPAALPSSRRSQRNQERLGPGLL